VTLPEIMVTPEIVVANAAGAGLSDGAATVAFGSTSLGSSDSTRTLTLSNQGTASLTGLTATMDGTNRSDFTRSLRARHRLPLVRVKTSPSPLTRLRHFARRDLGRSRDSGVFRP